jgi:hypothetical protein
LPRCEALLGRRHRPRRDRGQVGDDVGDVVGERSAGIQLMRAALPEERLDPGEESAHLRHGPRMATLDGLAHRNFVFLKPERSVEVARAVVAGSNVKGDAS